MKKLLSLLSLSAMLVAATTAHAEVKYRKRIIAIKQEQLALESTGKSLEAEQYKSGDRVVYDGEPILITSNGISSMNTPSGETLYLKKGQVLVVCKNQYIDYRDFSFNDNPGPKVVRTHFIIKLDGHSSDCSCGMCGYTAEILKDPAEQDNSVCSCEQQDPIDPGNQSCVVM